MKIRISGNHFHFTRTFLGSVTIIWQITDTRNSTIRRIGCQISGQQLRCNLLPKNCDIIRFARRELTERVNSLWAVFRKVWCKFTIRKWRDRRAEDTPKSAARLLQIKKHPLHGRFRICRLKCNSDYETGTSEGQIVMVSISVASESPIFLVSQSIHTYSIQVAGSSIGLPRFGRHGFGQRMLLM